MIRDTPCKGQVDGAELHVILSNLVLEFQLGAERSNSVLSDGL